MKRPLVIAARAGIAVAAIAAGVVVFSGLVASKPEAHKRQAEHKGLLVETQAVEAGSHQLTVDVQGLVAPAEQVTLMSEVIGQVRWVNPRLTAGGLVKKGEVLVRVDPRDYRLAVSQADSAIERARVELELERARKQVAEREWKILGEPAGEGGDAAARARALREPQIRAARNALAAAKSGKQRAELLVAKTTIRAPFNAIVQSETVGVGQLVAPQSPIATLVWTDRFHVIASVPSAQLPAVKVPGARATIRHATGLAPIVTEGRAVRMLGDLDPAGQMARVILEIDDPLALDDGAQRRPMLLGSHVQIELDAGSLEDVVALPREALHDGREVFVMTDGELEVRPVEIAWRTERTVFVSHGLEEGEQVVLSTITAPMPGMKLRAESAGSDSKTAAR